MISILKKKQSEKSVLKEIEKAEDEIQSATLSLLPGSEGEHLLQKKYATRQRALKFYDKQVLNHLSPIMREFIPKQQVMFIATADNHGDCDCSSRFGNPGFVRVIDQKFLIYPEYRGNGVFASQGNILENPHIGIIFVDFFETTVGLHVNGAARIIDNNLLLESRKDLPENIISELQREGNKRPERWIMVEVEEAYIHCSKHVPLLKKLEKRIDWGTDDMAAKGGDFFQIEQLTPYARIGGDEALKKVVDKLYRKIIADPEISHFLESMDIITQIERIKAFLSMLFDNDACIISTIDLQTAYQHLLNYGLTEIHFKRLTGYLDDCLNALEIPAHEIDAAMKKLALIRNDVQCDYNNIEL